MFESEAALISAFKKSSTEVFLKQILPGPIRRYALIEEFDSCNGVADVVLAVFRPYVRLDKTRLPINHSWLSPLANLPEDKVISLDEYVALYGISSRTARKQLDCYIKSSFVEESEKDTFRVTKSYTPFVETTVAIEAKLRDWKKALHQAYRYKRFANFSFVLLPATNASRAIQNLNLFKQYGIGLVTLEENDLQIHFAPTRRDSITKDAFLRVNESAYREIIAA